MTERMPKITIGLVIWRGHHGQIWSDNVDRWIKCVGCDIQTRPCRRPSWSAMPSEFRHAVDRALAVPVSVVPADSAGGGS